MSLSSRPFVNYMMCGFYRHIYIVRYVSIESDFFHRNDPDNYTYSPNVNSKYSDL